MVLNLEKLAKRRSPKGWTVLHVQSHPTVDGWEFAWRTNLDESRRYVVAVLTREDVMENGAGAVASLVEQTVRTVMDPERRAAYEKACQTSGHQ